MAKVPKTRIVFRIKFKRAYASICGVTRAKSRDRDGFLALSVERICRLVDSALAEKSEADSARIQHQEVQARLAAIVTSSADAIVGKTLDGIVTSLNETAEHMFGYPASEMIGQSIRRLIPADRQAEEDMILGCLARGERVEHYETVRIAKDGRTIDVSVTVSPMRDAEGRVIGASKIARDITARKQAEGLLRRQADLLARCADDRLLTRSSAVKLPATSWGR